VSEGIDFKALYQIAVEWESDQQQDGVLASLAEWHAQGLGQFITVGGYAGTGKTHVAARVAARLGLPENRIARCAPTGKAALVLQDRLEREGLAAEVRTIHSLIYLPQEWNLCGCGRCRTPGRIGERTEPGTCRQPLRNRRGHVRVARTYVLRPGGLPGISLIIADEGSMIGRAEWDNLLRLGVRIIVFGDHGQLKPVKSSFSLMADPDLRLEVVRRQAAGDPITVMATLARTTGWIPHGAYGPLARKLTPEQANVSEAARWRPGTLMIAARRATAVRLNQMIRADHLPGVTTTLAAGDQVICLQNDRGLGIRNGQILTVAEIVSDDDRKITFITSEGEELTAAAAQFGEDELLERSETPGWAGLFGYGYCITCHKSQGSEADRVIVVEEDWPRNPDERRRWLYTACTRARTELTVVGP
jgi:UvrD-like helicase C-terminal domain/AAA domain